MRIAIMQPTYLPWIGYFELMANSEYFVFFDNVQFNRKSWHQRNKIKSTDGELLITTPILSKGERHQKINEVIINNNENWARKHYASIEFNYKKAPYFDNYIGDLKNIYSKKHTKLIDFNLTIINYLKDKIGIKTPTILSSELNVTGSRDEHIINICRKLDADILYDAAGAKEFLSAEVFNKNGIKLVFQNYKHPIYKQLHGLFISHLSVLDLLFNEGEKSLEIIKSGVD